MKTCLHCHESKPLAAFPVQSSQRDGHRNVCRACFNDRAALRRGGEVALSRRTLRQAAKPGERHCYGCSRVVPEADYVTSNKRCRECVKAKERARDAERRAVVDAAKSRPCQDCGQSYPPYVMDLDHRPGSGKILNLAAMVSGRSRYSLDDIRAEIAKCDVVCANCHRVRTFARSLDVAGGTAESRVVASPPKPPASVR